MSTTVRSLKRKDKLRSEERKQETTLLTKTISLPNLKEGSSSRMNSAKSERFLESIIQVDNNIQSLNQASSSIPENIQEAQSKINIFGYEVMESRERFTVI